MKAKVVVRAMFEAELEPAAADPGQGRPGYGVLSIGRPSDSASVSGTNLTVSGYCAAGVNSVDVLIADPRLNAKAQQLNIPTQNMTWTYTFNNIIAATGQYDNWDIIRASAQYNGNTYTDLIRVKLT